MSRVKSNQRSSSKSEWKRLVEDNRELQRALRTLITKYGYSSLGEDNTRNYREVLEWWDTTDREVQLQFHQELQAISEEHSIPERLRDELLGRFILGFREYYSLDSSVKLRLEGKPGNKHRTIIIGIRADITDPFCQEQIRWWQRNAILDDDPPPQPKQGEGKAGNDWRPVREWYERNSGVFTLEELATRLGYQASYLRRKLSEVASLK